MMKYFKLLLIAMLVLTSCEDQLDISSEDDVSPEVALNNQTTVNGLVVGLYSQAQAADAFNGTPQVLSEWWADNSDFKGSFPTFRAVEDYTAVSTNTSINAIWVQNLDVIEACNFVLNRLPSADVDGLSDDLRSQYLAEASFLRALTMFNMSVYFGQPYQFSQGSSLSIPIILDTFDGSDLEPFTQPRNTLNEVYAQIQSDLTIAINGLPASYATNADTRSRATSGAAMALMARLDLYRENYASAAQLATDVLNSDLYELAGDYSFYNGLTSEDVFTIINTPQDSQNSNEGYGGLTNPQPEGRGDAPFSQNLIDAYNEEPDDLRFSSLTQMGQDAAQVNSVFSTKFDDGVNNADNAPIIRVTEMYLIRAEANFKNGTSIGATPLNDINILRDRAGLSPVAVVDIDRILIERRKELAFEGGHRRIDLLRNERGLRVGLGNESAGAFGADRTIFPIPQNSIDLVPALEQNPGY